MTNAQIILEQRIQLMEQGIIGTTGRKMIAELTDKDGNKRIEQINEPEEIHTYQGWKELGYQVNKGEKAIASFVIWKYTAKKGETSDDPETKMIRKKSHFFKRLQVKEIGQA